MQTIDPTTSRSTSSTRAGKRLIVLAACIAIALLASVGVKLWLDHRVPSPDADADRLSRYMSSPAFATLTDAQKAPYLEAFQRASDRGQLTPQQQHGVIRNLSTRNGKNPIQQYFSLLPKKREKFLDDVIDRVLKEDKHHAPPGKSGEKQIRIDGGRMADAIPPEDRAQMGQFLQDLHDRRVARGVPDDGKFLFARPN